MKIADKDLRFVEIKISRAYISGRGMYVPQSTCFCTPLTYPSLSKTSQSSVYEYL